MSALKKQGGAIIEEQRKQVHWGNTVNMVLLHLGAVAALFMWDWNAFLVALFLYWVAGSLGIGMGYHRLLTHRGYKVPKAVEYFMTVCGTLALEDGPLDWVATHRIHHAHTDIEGDPHTPHDGRWWSHMGWVLMGTAQQHDRAVLTAYAPDLMKDRFYVWLNRFFFVPTILLGLILFALGGWPMLMWGVCMRVTIGLHATWLVNSAAHIWGTRRFTTQDDSKNSWWVALLTFGEGWHNNHHAYPSAARHGLAWYEIDINWWGIRTLQLLRLARSIKLARLSSPLTETNSSR